MKEAIKVLNEEHGKKVIEYLESIGGVNGRKYEGRCIGCYYFIDLSGTISYNYNLPPGYTAITLPEEKTFPRKMLVWDNIYAIPVERIVITDLGENFQNRYVVEAFEPLIDNKKRVICYNFAKEIPEPEEMTLEQVCKELGKEIKIIK